jgi:hypothetical protein
VGDGWDDLCSGVGDLMASQDVTAADHGRATVHVRRRFSFPGVGRSYRVFVDGREVHRLGAGEEQELEVRAGPHRIEVRVGSWARSEPCDFSAGSGDVLAFDCRPRSLGEIGFKGLFRPYNYRYALAIDRRPSPGRASAADR